MATSRTLSVLVADVVESTPLFAELGSALADTLRRALFAALTETVEANGGTLVKTMGDGCLATFPAAADAVSAGVSVHSAAALATRHGVAPRLRVGVAVGDVTVEEDDDVFGTAVIVASRLCSVAAPGQVLVTDVVKALAGDRGGHRYELQGPLALKGLPEPVPASRVVVPAAQGTDTLPPSMATRPGEVLVGREEEWERLSEAWQQAAVGHRRAVLLAGEPGIGKTRLAARLARRVHGAGDQVLFGSAEEDLPVPYQPFAEALRPAVDGADPALLADHVAACGGELARLVPELARRVPETPAPIAATPELERLRLFDAVVDLLRRLSRGSPILLVLDDLQWAAPGTVHLLRHLLHVEEPMALLIVVTYRNTEVDRSGVLGGLLADVHRVTGIELVSLGGLDEVAIEAYLAAVSDDARIAVSGDVLRRTGGNPFFTTQLVRHLRDAGLALDRGGGLLSSPVPADVGLPRGLVEVLDHRLARLAPETSETLTTAAVAGLGFSLRTLRVAVDGSMGTDELIGALDDALAAHLITETGPGRYSFVHAIVREALVERLSAARCATVHARLARALIELHGQGTGRHVPLIAHHLIEAAVLGDTGALAQWSVAAAAQARDQADAESASALLERAGAALDEIEPPDHRAHFDVAMALADVRRLRDDEGGPAANREAVRRAVAAARALGSAPHLARAVLVSPLTWVGVGSGDPELVDLMDEALVGLGPDDGVLRAAMLVTKGWAQLAMDEPEGMALVEAAITVADRSDEPGEVHARVWNMAAMCLLGMPGAERRLRLAQQAIDAVPPPGADGPVGRWRIDGRGWVFDTPAHRAPSRLTLGDRRGFESDHRALASVAEATGYHVARWHALRGRALLALLDGRFAEVSDLAEDALARLPNDPNYQLYHEVQMAWLAGEQGTLADRAPTLERFAAGATKLPGARALLARSLLAASRRDEARAVMGSILDRWARHARGWNWPIVPFSLAEVAVELEDVEAAHLLCAELDPYAGELLVLGSGIFVAGAQDRVRGMVRTLLGQHDEAVVCLEAAIEIEERVASPPLAARSRYWLARALLGRGGPQDEHRARAEATRSGAVASSLGMSSLAHQVRALSLGWTS